MQTSTRDWPFFRLPLILAAFCLGLLPVATAHADGGRRTADNAATADAGPLLKAMVEADWIERDNRFAESTPGVPATAAVDGLAVKTSEDAAGGCDGVKNGLWGFHVASREQDPWWQVDLGKACRLDRVEIYNRLGGSEARTQNIRVLVGETPGGPFTEVYRHDGPPFYGIEKGPLVVRLADRDVTARVVRLQVPGRCSLALDEVEVYAADDPATNVALHKPADQISVSKYSRPGTMSDAEYAAYGFTPKESSASAATPGSFSLAHTRQVLDRAVQLAARLKPSADPERLAPLSAELDQLARRLAALESSAGVSADARRAIYFDARRLARKIAFTNPLLNFDKLLFLKRHDSVGVFHMCDQYYGCNAKPGGGLFVLKNPFGDNPRLVDLLKDSVVQNGRLAGQKLEGGTFLSPELSFDGQTIYFAYSQAKAYDTFQGKECYVWGPEISYHVFRCNANGSDLVQLTDGPWDDFDPCELPSGRIAFVSERRGGYLRCGRHCPVYTMFSMEPDGSDIVCLSFHETHEWQPSVTNDGRIIYTRWDYVDRDTNVAHHPWICNPDGRDPRSFHGNYPEKRESRPWMEMNIRAIPGSQKFVASTGAHHGHEFGSLVILDQRVEDDGAMSQLERLTPDVPFPEAEGGKGNVAKYSCYGTPWPLSEDDFLCVYDADAANRGVYWIDRYGNKELIYRDSEISCTSPIPLRPRPAPPVIPSQTTQAARDAGRAGAAETATVSLMNVYQSDFPWPADTKITSLRIIQVLPKSTAPPNQPRIGVADQTNARAVLGTVPVEADGSAHFEAPVGVPIYFQALDARGMAVQSMRSATYLHPGETLSCLGCHEGKRTASLPAAETPLAMQRPPSTIEPDVDGSNPFNYVRLVQPVLNRNCVACHQEKKALDLTGPIEGKYGWTRSYANLAGKYGFYFDVQNGSINRGVHGGSRTVPGHFGAQAAPLLDYMDQRHYGVSLSKEDYHRLVLWLDANSEFYGSYEDTEAQARGEVVLPTLY